MVSCSNLYPFIPRLAYCNLRVQYWTRTRIKLSKEIFTRALRPYDDVKVYFDGVRDIWNGSQACIRLKSAVESARPQCNKIVGFALGEICREVHERWVQRSAFQHALILTLRHALRPYHLDKENIVCYTQDPAYSEVDKLLLADYGIYAVDDPEGLLQVDNSSAILSCSPDVPIREIISEVAYSALMIWDKIKNCAPQVLGYVNVVEESLIC